MLSLRVSTSRWWQLLIRILVRLLKILLTKPFKTSQFLISILIIVILAAVCLCLWYSLVFRTLINWTLTKNEVLFRLFLIIFFWIRTLLSLGFVIPQIGTFLIKCCWLWDLNFAFSVNIALWNSMQTGLWCSIKLFAFVCLNSSRYVLLWNKHIFL